MIDNRLNKGCGCGITDINSNSDKCISWCGKNMTDNFNIRATFPRPCTYRKNNMKSMINSQLKRIEDLQRRNIKTSTYNELVLDPDIYIERMPDIIYAFFYPTGIKEEYNCIFKDNKVTYNCKNKVINNYNSFKRKYPNSNVPLLEFNLSRPDNPFSISSNSNI